MKLTSVMAHDSIVPVKSRFYRLILAGLKKINQGTSKEIAKAANLTDEQTRKRLSEMERLDLIEVSGVKKCNVTGRMCQEWKIKTN